MTPAEAQAQYDEIMANKKHPYWQRGMTQAKKAAMAEVHRLKRLSMGPAGARTHAVLGMVTSADDGSN